MLRQVVSQDWFTLWLLICLVLLALAKWLNHSFFTDFIALPVHRRYLSAYRKTRKIFNLFSVILVIHAIITLTIFVRVTHPYLRSVESGNLPTKGVLMLGLASFLFLKLGSSYGVGILLGIKSAMTRYLFYTLTYINYLGFVLLPLNALLIYGFALTDTAVYVALLICILIVLEALINMFKLYQKLIKAHLFYFILYLCIVEIGSYVLAYKLLFQV